MDCDAIIIGSGPAGLMAAIRAAQRGRRIILLERNRQFGAKILISGGGHCNLTHATDAAGVVSAFGASGKFLHSALARFGPAELREFFQLRGLDTVTDPDGKVFPISRNAADVVKVLVAEARDLRVPLVGGEAVESIVPFARPERGSAWQVVTSRQRWISQTVLIATGGCSYPHLGTRGDGYRFAVDLGHTVVSPRPALAPLVSPEAWVRRLQGIALPDAVVEVRVRSDAVREVNGTAVRDNEQHNSPHRVVPTERHPKAKRERSPLRSRSDRWRSRGPLLFTHFGLSGPAAMNVSREVSACPPGDTELVCDFLPEHSMEQWRADLDKASVVFGKRTVVSVLADRLPRRLAEVLVAFSGAEGIRTAECDRTTRRRLAETVKCCRIALNGTRGFQHAEVTAGGVALEEVDPRTMESRIAPGVFFAGEVLDLDGPIGGFNLQAAFSTGFLAGEYL